MSRGRKSKPVILTDKEREYLKQQTRARTIQAQTVTRAKILLLRAAGVTIENIAEKVVLNRKIRKSLIAGYFKILLFLV